MSLRVAMRASALECASERMLPSSCSTHSAAPSCLNTILPACVALLSGSLSTVGPRCCLMILASRLALCNCHHTPSHCLASLAFNSTGPPSVFSHLSNSGDKRVHSSAWAPCLSAISLSSARHGSWVPALRLHFSHHVRNVALINACPYVARRGFHSACSSSSALMVFWTASPSVSSSEASS